MLRLISSIIAGFLAWAITWGVSEMIFSMLSPDWFGAHQRAFTAAIKSGGTFSADSTVLLIHVVCATLISLMAGFLAAFIARDNKRAPLFLGILLTAFGLLKAVMSWPLVPLWYHLTFTALLLPMTLVGGRLRKAA